MTVGFFLVDTGNADAAFGFVSAAALMRSVRATMPGVPVVQFSDEQTAAVEGVDHVRRLPAEPMACLRMRHQAGVDGEWLFLDTDTIIQRDVRNVFAQPFDIALTTRNWPHLRPAAGFTARMPVNAGVVFSRSRTFWREAYARLLELPLDAQQWMGDQQAICDLIAAGTRFSVLFLKGTRYNLPPAVASESDDVQLYESAKLERKASILHYKGLGRKAMLLERIRAEEARPC